MSKKKQDYSKYLFYGLGGFAVLLLTYLLLISQMMRAAIYVTVFIGLSTLVSSYKKFIKFPIEIEILTLGIVLCTIKFGIKAGLVVAILGGILSFLVSFDFSPFSFPMLLGYISIAITAYFLGGLSITLVGIIATLVNNILVFSIYNFAFDYDLFKNTLFSLSNIILNVILFLNIAPFLFNLIL
jgi:hypothetical protein